MKSILTCISAGAIGAFLATGITVAEQLDAINVMGTRSIDVQVERDTNGTASYKIFSLTYGVKIAGLDLTTAAGAADLEKRVNDAALAICKEIGRQYPESTPNDELCAKQAAKKSMVKAHQLIDAARKAPMK
jgi:UrcA family protein